MTTHRKNKLLFNHAFSHLHLVHAATVDSYEVHSTNNRMPVNRFLCVTQDDTHQRSVLRDIRHDLLLPMRQNHLYFIPCDYLIDMDLEPDLHFVSFQFNIDIFFGFDVFSSYPRCETRHLSDLIPSLPSLLAHEEDFTTLCRVNEIIYALCASFAQAGDIHTKQKWQHSSKYQRVLEYVTAFCDAATTVDHLAQMNSMRADVFSRNFKRDLGIPPKKFITDTLTRKASTLLMTPDVLIKHVAEKLNFSSEYYFSNFFKKQTGLSPKEFRQHNGIR